MMDRFQNGMQGKNEIIIRNKNCAIYELEGVAWHSGSASSLSSRLIPLFLLEPDALYF